MTVEVEKSEKPEKFEEHREHRESRDPRRFRWSRGLSPHSRRFAGSGAVPAGEPTPPDTAGLPAPELVPAGS